MTKYINLLKNIFDTIQEGLILLDDRNRIVLANKRFLEIFEYRITDVIEKNIFEIEKGDFNIPEFKKLISDIIPEKKVIENYEIEKEFKNIGRKIVTINARQIYSEENLPYILIAFHDITDKRKREREEELIRKQIVTSQRLESITRFASGIIHDLKNILGAIMGYAELSARKIPDNNPAYENMYKIVELCQRAASLSKKLITFAKQEPSEPHYINPNYVIEDLLNLLEKIMGDEIKIEFIPAPVLKTVHIDPTMFEQIILNLSFNARDAMPEGGKLIIETQNIYLDDEYLRTHYNVKKGDYVMIAISDTGKGIPAGYIPYIFEPYFTTKKEKGTGLGLSVVHGIVHQHKGFINVYSEEGKGTTFKIYLPAQEEEPIEYRIIPKFREYMGGEKILVVEDDDDLREIIKWVLENFGYIVMTAKNGREGLTIYKDNINKINLVISDVVMPEMGGKELYNEIKKITPEIKFLFMSGYTENMIKNNFFYSPEIESISKPFTAIELLSKIKDILKS